MTYVTGDMHDSYRVGDAKGEGCPIYFDQTTACCRSTNDRLAGESDLELRIARIRQRSRLTTTSIYAAWRHKCHLASTSKCVIILKLNTPVDTFDTL
jgi:hypothetical protein